MSGIDATAGAALTHFATVPARVAIVLATAGRNSKKRARFA
jgi:hypothetical protein